MPLPYVLSKRLQKGNQSGKPQPTVLTFGTDLRPNHLQYHQMTTAFRLFTQCINDTIKAFNKSSIFHIYEAIAKKHRKKYNLKDSKGKKEYTNFLRSKGITPASIYANLCKTYNQLPNKNLYKKHVYSQCIQQYLKYVAVGYYHYFLGNAKSYPQPNNCSKYLKGKYTFKTIMVFPQGFKIDPDGMKVFLPKYKLWVHIHNNGITSDDLKAIVDKVTNVILIYVPHKKCFIVKLVVDAPMIPFYVGDLILNTTLLYTRSIGIDLGCKSLAVDSYGTKYDITNRQKERIRRIEKHISSIQAKITNIIHKVKSKGTWTKPLWQRFKRYQDKLLTLKQRIQNIHMDCIHKTILAILKCTDIVLMEQLHITQMKQSKKSKRFIRKNINKSLAKRQLATFTQKLKEKMYSLGKLLALVNPYHTSKTCSFCNGVNKDLEVKDRTYHCSHCGIILDRDHNAAINIHKAPMTGVKCITIPAVNDNLMDVLKYHIRFTVKGIQYSIAKEGI